jgi:hypothetical protein
MVAKKIAVMREKWKTEEDEKLDRERHTRIVCMTGNTSGTG